MRLYIDPGTGSMLFSIIIGLATTAFFVGKGLWIKLKQRASGGRVEVRDDKLPYVIFSDHKRYWNVFEPVCDELERRQLAGEYWTMSEDDPALKKPYTYVKCVFIGEGNKAFARLSVMSARVCLSTTPGLDVLQWKRSKNTDYYVHIYHALDDGSGYRMFALDHYDAVLLNAPVQGESTRRLEHLRGLPEKELVTVGCTYMDTLLKRYQEKGTPEKKNGEPLTVLCAPSWGESSILNRYGERFLDSLVATGYNIVLRPHPQSFSAETELMEKLRQRYPESERFHWNRDNDNFDILSRADILISDFSCVIFDYCLIFDRPFIYADSDYDKSPYDVAWFDDCLPWTVGQLDTVGRKLSVEDYPRMKEIIDSVIASDEYREGREYAKNLLWDCRGESAQRTADYLENTIRRLQKAL